MRNRANFLLAGLPLLPGLLLRFFSLRHYLQENPFSAHLFSDSHNYFQWAASIAAGAPWREPFYQAPLYPHFLALMLKIFGESLFPIYAAQLLLGCLSIYLVSRIALLFLRPPAAAAAALLYGVLPYPIYFEHKILPETLSIPVGLLALFLAVRAGRSAGGRSLAGAAAGLASIARANLIAFMLLLPMPFLRKEPRRVAAYFAAAFLVVLPVTMWNLAAGGGLIPVAANGGEVFSHGNNSNALGSMGKIPGFKAEIGSMSQSSVAFASRELRRDLNAAGASRYWFGRGFRWIARNPGAWCRLEGMKLRLIVSAHFTPLSAFHDFERDRFGTIAGFLRFLHYPLLVLALAGVLARRRAGKPIPGALHLFAAVQFLTPLIFFVSTRYMTPLLPILALYAGAGVEAIFASRRRWAILGAAAAGMVLAVWVDKPVKAVWATPYAQLASIRSNEGKGGEAISLYAEAVRIAPMELLHHQNLAVEQEKAGDIDAACRSIEVPVRMGIADGRTLGFHGSLLIAQEEWEGAELILREAVLVEPTRLLSRLLLGDVYLRTGQWEKAEDTFLWAGKMAPEDPRSWRGLLELYSGPLRSPLRAERISEKLKSAEAAVK